jgi:MYXO-CTERM domain-containing protein
MVNTPAMLPSSGRFYRVFPAFLLAAAALTAPGRPAEACSPPSAGLQQTIPAAKLPASSAIVFIGFGISLEGVKASVSGSPGSDLKLVAAQDRFPALFGTDGTVNTFSNAYFLDPPPPAGQTATISGNFCNGAPQCEKTVSFEVLPADSSAPEAPEDVHYDRYDYPDFKSSGGDCQNDSALGYWVHIKQKAAASEEVLVLYRVEAFADAALTKPLFGSVVLSQGAETAVAFRPMTAPAAPGDVCLRVTTFDSSGNASPDVKLTCKPCHSRTDPPAGTTNPSLPQEPAWTDADIAPGGACDPGGGQAGGGQAGAGGDQAGAAGSSGGGPAVSPVDPQSNGGCGCGVASQPPGAWGGLAALIGALAGRRRAARRRTT